MPKQKILLINPPIRESAQPTMFPSGLGYVAAALLNEGYDVKALDINGYRYDKEGVRKKLEDYLKNQDVDIVGIGCLITCYNYVKWLIKTIKGINPKIKVIVGGGMGSSIPEICIDKLKADIVVIGEGEIIIINLLKTLQNNESLSKVKGIAFKKGNSIQKTPRQERIKNLDGVPFPAWHLFPMHIYLRNMFEVEGLMGLRGNSINVLAGRGCPYQCTYCYETFEHVSVMRSVENVIEEVKVLMKDYNVKIINFVNDLFTMNKDWVMRFCDALMNEKIKLIWLCQARVNTMDEDMLRKMKQAGCIYLNVGFESGSQKMLNIMRKGTTVEQGKKAIISSNRTGVKINCNFMIGFPEDTIETIEETIKFCIENNLHLTSIFFVTPYPGTQLYEEAKRIGLVKDEEEFISRLGNATELTINLTKWSDEKLIELRNHVIKRIHWAYYRKNRLEYTKWLRKKIIWYARDIKKNGLKPFINIKINKVKQILA